MEICFPRPKKTALSSLGSIDFPPASQKTIIKHPTRLPKVLEVGRRSPEWAQSRSSGSLLAASGTPLHVSALTPPSPTHGVSGLCAPPPVPPKSLPSPPPRASHPDCPSDSGCRGAAGWCPAGWALRGRLDGPQCGLPPPPLSVRPWGPVCSAALPAPGHVCPSATPVQAGVLGARGSGSCACTDRAPHCPCRGGGFRGLVSPLWGRPALLYMSRAPLARSEGGLL